MHSVLATLGFLLIVVVAGVIDARSRRIPNVLILPAALGGVALNGFDPAGIGVTRAVGGLVLGLVIFVPFYALRTLGAGDVKLMAAIGAWVGPMSIVQIALLTMLAGGMLAVLVALRHRALSQALWNVLAMLRTASFSVPSSGSGLVPPPHSVGRLPYGIAIAVGTVSHLAMTHLGIGLMR